MAVFTYICSPKNIGRPHLPLAIYSNGLQLSNPLLSTVDYTVHSNIVLHHWHKCLQNNDKMYQSLMGYILDHTWDTDLLDGCQIG